jgi:hypothetical protein
MAVLCRTKNHLFTYFSLPTLELIILRSNSSYLFTNLVEDKRWLLLCSMLPYLVWGMVLNVVVRTFVSFGFCAVRFARLMVVIHVYWYIGQGVLAEVDSMNQQ